MAIVYVVVIDVIEDGEIIPFGPPYLAYYDIYICCKLFVALEMPWRDLLISLLMVTCLLR